MHLPKLSKVPLHYPDCCLSLSTVFVKYLRDIFQSKVQTGLILSIGSGTGMLEAFLSECFTNSEDCTLQIEGVEVKSDSGALNGYLSEELTNVVDGAWATCHRTQKASALMFVYPRAKDLINQYVREYCHVNSKVKLLVWLGPNADWQDFESCFDVAGFGQVHMVEHAGLVEYEMMAYIMRDLI